MKAMAVLIAGAVAALTACGGTPAAHHPTTHPTPATATTAPTAPPAVTVPRACAPVMRAVNDVARKAGIDLVTGSMHVNGVTRAKLASWSIELGKSWPRRPPPTAADLRFDEKVLAASIDAIDATHSQATAIKFIGALQKIAADCGQ